MKCANDDDDDDNDDDDDDDNDDGDGDDDDNDDDCILLANKASAFLILNVHETLWEPVLLKDLGREVTFHLPSLHSPLCIIKGFAVQIKLTQYRTIMKFFNTLWPRQAVGWKGSGKKDQKMVTLSSH